MPVTHYVSTKNDEVAMNSDVIEANFIDTYYNLTLKSRSALNYFVGNCRNSSLLVLLDDDVFVKRTSVFKAIQGSTAYELRSSIS